MEPTTTTKIPASHPRAKLTAHEVALIAEMIASGMSLREIAARFAKS